jgi:hypothetical protein
VWSDFLGAAGRNALDGLDQVIERFEFVGADAKFEQGVVVAQSSAGLDAALRRLEQRRFEGENLRILFVGEFPARADGNVPGGDFVGRRPVGLARKFRNARNAPFQVSTVSAASTESQ